MVNRQLMAYKTAEVGTASKVKLVIMMYDGAIRFLNECKKRMDAGDIAGRGLYISKAQRIVTELQDSLNIQQGGQIAVQLEELYTFLIHNLSKANIKGEKIYIDQSIMVLENLRDAWKQVMADTQSKQGENTTRAPQKVVIQL